VNVSAFVAVVTRLLFASATIDVIKAVALPSAIMLVLSAVFMTFAGVPNVVVTSTALWARFEAVAVTVAVPMAVMDCKVIVAMPLVAFFVVVPSNVPCPETVNVTAFVAVATVLLSLSHTLEVIKDVVLPSATMPVGLAVLRTFTGPADKVVTSTELWARLVAVVVTVAVPGVA